MHFQVNSRNGCLVLRFSTPGGINRLDTPALRWLLTFLNSQEVQRASGLVLYGIPNFGAGGDLRELAALAPLQARQYMDLGREVLLRLTELPIPTVAAIQQFALGGALELALAHTFRVATKEAWFGHPGARAGLFPGFVGVYLAGRYLRLGTLKRLLFTGERWSARQALQHGLVDDLVETPNDLVPRACDWIHRVRPGTLHALLP